MDIKISKTNKLCAGTEAPFEHGEGLVSLVRITEGQLVREDYKESAWNDSFRNGAYSLWKTSFYDPNVVEGDQEETFSPLRKLFYDAVEAESREELAIAFLAAQLLRRQKVFRLMKEADAEEGQTRLTLYTDRIGNRLIEVRDPNFSYAELETAQAELLNRLRTLEEPESPADAEGEEEAETVSDEELKNNAQDGPEDEEFDEEEVEYDDGEGDDSDEEGDSDEEDDEEFDSDSDDVDDEEEEVEELYD